MESAIAARPEGVAVVLDAGGEPLLAHLLAQRAALTGLGGVTIAVGPEGGLEAPELEALQAGGFHPVALGASILRFETAAIAGVAAVRAALDAFV